MLLSGWSACHPPGVPVPMPMHTPPWLCSDIHLDNASAGRLGEAQSADAHLWHVKQTHIVSDGGHHDGDLVVLHPSTQNVHRQA